MDMYFMHIKKEELKKRYIQTSGQRFFYHSFSTYPSQGRERLSLISFVFEP